MDIKFCQNVLYLLRQQCDFYPAFCGCQIDELVDPCPEFRCTEEQEVLEHESTIRLHLWSFDSRNQVPGIDEYGEDIEFTGGTRNNLCNHLEKAIKKKFSELKLDYENYINTYNLVRLVFGADHFKYILNILTDSTPCCPKDLELAYKRSCQRREGSQFTCSFFMFIFFIKFF